MTEPFDILSRDVYKAVDSIHHNDPSTLVRLRQEHALFEELLVPHAGPIQGRASDVAQHRFLADTWGAALAAEIDLCERAAAAAARDLASARRLDLSTSIGAAVAGSTLTAMLGGGVGSRSAQITVATITLACAVVSALSRLLRSTATNADKAKYYVKLWSALGQAKLLVIHLTNISKGRTAPDDALLERVEATLVALHDARGA